MPGDVAATPVVDDRPLAELLLAEPVVAVGDVVADGPAARAGLRPDDLLVRLGDTRLSGVADLQGALEGDLAGTRLVLTLLRDGRERQVVVVPDELEG